MKSTLALALVCLGMTALPAWATVCANSDGVAKDIAYNLTDVFTSANNQVGQIGHIVAEIGFGRC
jgi:hypothetical protein